MKAKLLNIIIILVVATGTAIIPFVGGASTGVEPLEGLFYAFVSAIIAVQIVPAIMLLGCFLKSQLIGRVKNLEQ